MLAMSRLCSATRWPRDAPVRGDRRLAADHERDVGRRAAHVEGNEVAVVQQPGSVLAAGDAAGRAGEHAARCQPHRLGNGRNAAVRLDDQHRRAQACLAQPRLEAGQVALQRRPDVGVDDSRAEAIVLLDLRQHLRGERDIDAGHGGAHGLGGDALVARRRASCAGSRWQRPPRPGSSGPRWQPRASCGRARSRPGRRVGCARARRAGVRAAPAASAAAGADCSDRP